MIQTTSPPAASRKWLRIKGGRIRLPASCCCFIPPRISQIESNTKPPPAVISQAMSAAHFMSAPLGSSRRAEVRLYAAKRYLLSLGIPAHCAAKHREQDATITVLAPAPAGIAADLYDGGAFERTREERRPHSAVDRAELRVCPDKRAQRAGGGRDHRAVTGYLRDGRLIAEVPQSGANTGQGSPERLCGTDSTLASELSTESDPDLVQALAAPVPGERIDSERDQLLVAAPGEFDGAQLRSHTIGLGRPPRSRPGSSGSPFEGGNQEPRSGEPLESTSC